MMSCRRLGGVVSVLTLVIAVTTGCARDGSFEPRGSIKDSPAETLPPRAKAARSAAKPRLPAMASETTPAAERRVAAPQAPPPALPATTSSPQPVPRVTPPTPPVQTARRPPVTGLQLLEEGRMLFRTGEVLAARERYVAALSAPLPDVLLELARTYDPNYLDRLPKSDADADLERARALYEQAATLGSKSAEADLQRLQSNQ